MVLCAALLGLGCSQAEPSTSTNQAPAAEKFVVIETDHGHATVVGGPIKGSVACSQAEPPSGVCLAHDLPLAEAVLNCGPVQVTVDRRTSHQSIVYFSAGMHERFPSIPPDLDIVRCVQQQIGFSFRAYISDDPTEVGARDQRPFVSLHSR